MQDNSEFLPGISSSKDRTIKNDFDLVTEDNARLDSENQQLRASLEREELYHRNLYNQWSGLKTSILNKEHELGQLKAKRSSENKVHPYNFYSLLLFTVFLIAFNFNSIMNSGLSKANSLPAALTKDKMISAPDKKGQSLIVASDKVLKNSSRLSATKAVPADSMQMLKDQFQINADTTVAVKGNLSRYVVKVKSYFHNKPDSNTRRNTFVLPWDDEYGILTALADKNGFIYIVFTNRAARTSKGWIRKTDLEPLRH